ncbi:hypothetical protein K458DRAFT_391905 [Lentithecium fluviatile CBS 122367]|uniref:Uncharacterized protein n=1 Tax=Lentithecium fluviatile CBS 122367 TaxID=1168545 RepID=A0A6G1IU99_9PLEO|nr:hypothetical protein K458DRAFT_391905 [Lentithecium fluviatile CBS 122367]
MAAPDSMSIRPASPTPPRSPSTETNFYNISGDAKYVWRHTPVNLVQFEPQYGAAAIFTRQYLQRIARGRDLVLKELQKASKGGRTRSFNTQSLFTDEKWKVWKLMTGTDKGEEQSSDVGIEVYYSTRVELYQDHQNMEVPSYKVQKLQIDEHSLVVVPFVPMDVPLMQIVADMFPPGQGPAGFIVNEIDISPGRELYCYNGRSSPGVERLLQHCELWSGKFDGERLGDALKEDAYIEEQPYRME